jgi:hypothetical protein
VAASREEGTKTGGAVTRRFVHALKSRTLLPLDATEDLPPHLVGQVALDGTRASVVHSFDLDNLRQFPFALEALVEGPDPTDAQVEASREFLEDQRDGAYLRRAVMGGNRARVEQVLRGALRRDPYSEGAHHLLLEFLESEARWEESTEEAERYASLGWEPSATGSALLDLAEVLSVQGRSEEAVAALDRPRPPQADGGLWPWLGAFRSVHEARALRTVDDVVHATAHLADYLAMVAAEAEKFMPGAFDEAVEAYRALPEWTERPRGDGEESTPEDTNSFHLYFAFAHRSNEWPDPPSEALSRGLFACYGLDRLVDRAIHGSRSGEFQVSEVRASGPGRRLLRVRDVLTREELAVSLSGARSPGDPLDTVGTVFRAHLVPWGDLWFCRGPVEVASGTENAPAAPAGPRLWFAAVTNPRKEVWTSFVIEGALGLVAGIEAENYVAPGPVTRALESSYRSQRGLPDLLVTDDGYPFVDPSGRTATSWREPAVRRLEDAFRAPGPPRTGIAHGGGPFPHPVSLLKPWVETFGVRHVTDPRVVARATREFRTVLSRGSTTTRQRERRRPGDAAR